MKQSPHEQRITERMAPGVLCREGFLGADPRPLGEILDADRSALEVLGVSQEQIAERLAAILDAAVAALGRPVQPSGHLAAVWHEAMGRIPSPFADGLFAKGEVELTDARAGRTLRFTPLSVHLIRRHGFFQGRGSRYRLEPEALCRTLDLPPA